MRYILMLALFLACLSPAAAADDSVTKRNNDAGTRLRGFWVPAPYRSVVKPVPEDLRPTK
jgi:hypothetical protein